MCKHKTNVCQSRKLHINSTMKATIRTLSIILQKCMENLQIPGFRVITHSKCHTEDTELYSYM